MQRAGVFALLFVVGMLVFFVAGYWAGIPYGARTAAKLALPCLLLAATFASGRSESLRRWRPVSLAFFAASFAFLVAWWVSEPLMGLFGLTTDSVPGIAFMKLFDALPIVVTIVVVARHPEDRVTLGIRAVSCGRGPDDHPWHIRHLRGPLRLSPGGTPAPMEIQPLRRSMAPRGTNRP